MQRTAHFYYYFTLEHKKLCCKTIVSRSNRHDRSMYGYIRLFHHTLHWCCEARIESLSALRIDDESVCDGTG